MIPLKLLVGFIALLIILNPLLSSLLDAKPGEVSAKYYPMVHQIGAVVKEDPSSANEEQKQVLEKKLCLSIIGLINTMYIASNKWYLTKSLKRIRIFF